MNDLRAAAQQVLEALEAMQSYAAAERKGLRICDEAIPALRAALKQEEEASAWLTERREYWRKEKEKMQATNALRSALAQQAEPVDADAAYQMWLEDTHAPALRRIDSQGAFSAGWQAAALAQQDEPVDGACLHGVDDGACKECYAANAEPMAWVASKDGRVIYDNAFAHDVMLRVAGDFEDDEQRARYAQRIVDKLNATPPQRLPLTEDEIYHATGHCGVSRYTAINITRAVEQAHEIKE